MVADELVEEWTLERAKAELDIIQRPFSAPDDKRRAVIVKASALGFSGTCDLYFPGLTGRQNLFLREWLCNGNQGANAYRFAFDVTDDRDNHAIALAASHMLRSNAIQDAIKLVRAEVAKTVACDLEEHLRELMVLRDMAKSRGDIKAAIAAEVARGKAAGHYIERIKNVDDEGQKKLPPPTADEFAAIAAAVAKEC